METLLDKRDLRNILRFFAPVTCISISLENRSGPCAALQEISAGILPVNGIDGFRQED